MQKIAGLSIFFMVVSELIAVGLPVGMAVLFCRKYRSKLMPAVFGAAAFALFALVLERMLHSVVLAAGSPFISSALLYTAYGAAAAGIFEETGRFIVFRLIKKRYPGVRNALTYAVGHGGLESAGVGLGMLSNIILAAAVNTGALDALSSIQGLVSLSPEVLAATLNAVPPVTYLASGIERISALALHTALSAVVFYSAAEEGGRSLFPMAILLHAIANIPALLYQAGVIRNIWVVEALTAAAAVGVVLFAKSVHSKMKLSAAAPQEPGGDDQPSSENSIIR